jgi:hypothetical protein
MAHVCNPIYSGGRDQEDLGLKPAWANTSRPYLKKTHYKKRADGVAQEVECLPSKREDLSSNSITAKGKKKNNLLLLIKTQCIYNNDIPLFTCKSRKKAFFPDNYQF